MMPLDNTLKNYELKSVKDYNDILYHKCEGVAKVTINRTHRRNAFTPDTVQEMIEAFSDARDDDSIGEVLLCGANPQNDGQYAFARVVIKRFAANRKAAISDRTEFPD